jgi:hypothetical protein
MTTLSSVAGRFANTTKTICERIFGYVVSGIRTHVPRELPFGG